MSKQIIEPRTLKGFRDFGPKEQLARQQMFQKIQAVFERFGFLPMATPVLEYAEILKGKIGEDEKLIYEFKDNGERDVAMRYDLTVPLARYVAENQGSLVFPFKRYQIAPVWRAENTQKGRLREFYQCDIDVVGTELLLADAEVMACLCGVLQELGIINYELRINDRRNFENFGKEVIRAIDKLDKLGWDGVLSELQKQNFGEDVIKEVESMFVFGTKQLPYQKNLEDLKALIENMGVSSSCISISPSIARGLDYYTSTVFEIVLKGNPEFGSIAGGGRYDGLIDKFSEKSLPAVGGSIGIDRLFAYLEESKLLSLGSTIKVLVVNVGESNQKDLLEVTTQLRNSEISTEMYFEPVKLEKQLKYAENKGIQFAVILGKTDGEAEVREIKTRQSKNIKFEQLTDYLGNA